MQNNFKTDFRALFYANGAHSISLDFQNDMFICQNASISNDFSI